MMMMNDFITHYLIETYAFTSGNKSWCVIDRVSNKSLEITQLIDLFERTFPNCNSKDIVIDWFNKNLEVNINKVNDFLSQYKVIETNQPMVWSVVSKNGKKFELSDLMNKLPRHFHPSQIILLYDEWYYDEKCKMTEKLMYGKHKNI